MGIFKYKEKRYGKLTFILFAIILVLLAVASVIGGIYAVVNMAHWVKYIILVVASIIGLALGSFGIFLVALSFSLINQSKSVRDENNSKGISGTRLCDQCGRVISKKAEFCEHCGKKQQSGLGMKKCTNCKTLNSALAEFCEKCGEKFEN